MSAHRVTAYRIVCDFRLSDGCEESALEPGDTEAEAFRRVTFDSAWEAMGDGRHACAFCAELERERVRAKEVFGV